MVREHLRGTRRRASEGLLFPATRGEHVALHLYRVFYPRPGGAGRADLRFHDLRHTGAVLAATDGRDAGRADRPAGHSTPGAALRYQPVAQDRDRVIAVALSALVAGHVPIDAVSRKKTDVVGEDLTTSLDVPGQLTSCEGHLRPQGG